MDQASSKRAAELRREYHKQWRAKHKDKVKEYNRRFWEKRAEKQRNDTDKAAQDN